MTQQEREKIDEIVTQLRVVLSAPTFGTPEHYNAIDDACDELELLILDSDKRDPLDDLVDGV